MVQSDNEMDVDEFIEHYPRLYHMAEGGSWDSICRNGLLSTSSLLDLYRVSGEARYGVEASHRPHCVSLSDPILGVSVIRDQKPMDDNGLVRALADSALKPSDWYCQLNSQVFFWTSKSRLHRLLNASAYADLEHDVLTIDTRKLVEEYEHLIRLCPINSGCTRPFPTPRGEGTFLPISDYPFEYWTKKRRRPIWDAVVEVCVIGAVPHVVDCAVSVYRMKGGIPLHAIVPPAIADGH